jgi:hypothetical protein
LALVEIDAWAEFCHGQATWLRLILVSLRPNVKPKGPVGLRQRVTELGTVQLSVTQSRFAHGGLRSLTDGHRQSQR